MRGVGAKSARNVSERETRSANVCPASEPYRKAHPESECFDGGTGLVSRVPSDDGLRKLGGGCVSGTVTSETTLVYLPDAPEWL